MLAGILGQQADMAVAPEEALEGQSAVLFRHDEVAVGRLEGAVHHQQVAVVDAGAGHRLAVHADEEGRLAVRDEMFVQVEAVVGGRVAHAYFRKLPVTRPKISSWPCGRIGG